MSLRGGPGDNRVRSTHARDGERGSGGRVGVRGVPEHQSRCWTLTRDLTGSALQPDLDRFVANAGELGFSERMASGVASPVIARLLIETCRDLDELAEADSTDLAVARLRRQEHTGRAQRLLAVGTFLAKVTRVGWDDAPTRRLAYGSDLPRPPCLRLPAHQVSASGRAASRPPHHGGHPFGVELAERHLQPRAQLADFVDGVELTVQHRGDA